MSSSGMTPAHMPTGMTPNHMPSGMTPSHMPSGMTPNHMPSGMTPSHMPSGMTPGSLSSGMTPSHMMMPPSVSSVSSVGKDSNSTSKWRLLEYSCLNLCVWDRVFYVYIYFFLSVQCHVFLSETLHLDMNIGISCSLLWSPVQKQMADAEVIGHAVRSIWCDNQHVVVLECQ